MKISEIFFEQDGQLAVEKDDDKMTSLVDKATGVRTIIDKKNPKSPKLTQGITGQYSISPTTPGATAKPPAIKPGTVVAVQKPK